ncbi:hypothetical protein C8Q78DRAFT_1020056 [Trametes maxima]|nr:hypothetical protein C8Q78DRAFT_1020056 [Trametes maxima]
MSFSGWVIGVLGAPWCGLCILEDTPVVTMLIVGFRRSKGGKRRKTIAPRDALRKGQGRRLGGCRHRLRPRTFVFSSGCRVAVWMPQDSRTLNGPRSHSAAHGNCAACWYDGDRDGGERGQGITLLLNRGGRSRPTYEKGAETAAYPRLCNPAVLEDRTWICLSLLRPLRTVRSSGRLVSRIQLLVRNPNHWKGPALVVPGCLQCYSYPSRQLGLPTNRWDGATHRIAYST